MLAGQGKPSVALLTVCLVSLFAFAFAASTHGQWQGHKTLNSGTLEGPQYLKVFQQQQQPLREPLFSNDDDTSGRLAFYPSKQVGQQQQQPAENYYSTSSAQLNQARQQQQQQHQQLLLADQLRREKLARQLQLARQLLAERIGRRQLLAPNADEDVGQSAVGVELPAEESSLDALTDRGELLAKLAAKIRASDDNDDQQALTSDYLLSSKSLAVPDKPLFVENNNDNDNEEQQAVEDPKNEYFYELQQEEKRDEPSGQPQQIVEEPQEKTATTGKAGKFTTLLEDEEASVVGENQVANTTTTSTITTGTSSPAAATLNRANVTTSSKVVPSIQQNATKEALSSDSSVSSMLGRMFSRISSYLPFLKQIDMLNEPKELKQPTNGANEATRQPTKATGSPTRGGADAKQSVSDTADLRKGDEHNNNQVDLQAKDKPSTKAKVSEEKGSNVASNKDLSNDNDFASLGRFENVKVEAETNKNVDARGELSNSKRVHFEGDDRIDLDIGQRYSPTLLQQQQQPNLLRSSNLVVPISSTHDELLVEHSSRTPGAMSDGIVSRYIYAPTHHYYLTHPDSKLLTPPAFGGQTNDNSGSRFEGFFGAPSGEVEQPAQMSHRSYQSQRQQHQFIPGEHIFSSYDSLKPAYAFQKNGLEGIALVNGADNNGNKSSNDVYFLVMVGAFCVMAMAVVLAAGMFAYRVQQNRKSSQDTDYPTYGVVGPNNMDGKCGAAAFMGGYLGGTGGPGSSGSFGSKSGSAKHLSDMYASDSGLASTDKGSSKKASLASASSASTPQDNQHQQHLSGNRTSPGNSLNLTNNQDAARMYHYQHQKQQMIISDRGAPGGRHTSASDLDSEDENDEGSYTVYECPGLASAHEMEIKNPLFNDDHSP